MGLLNCQKFRRLLLLLDVCPESDYHNPYFCRRPKGRRRRRGSGRGFRKVSLLEERVKFRVVIVVVDVGGGGIGSGI